jgi:hypothetical protein
MDVPPEKHSFRVGKNLHPQHPLLPVVALSAKDGGRATYLLPTGAGRSILTSEQLQALGASFEHGVEGGSGYAAEPCKAGRSHHLSNPRLPGLGTECQSNFL